MTNFWTKALEWEHDWWGSCVNTYGEEEKQLFYADRMGLHFFHDSKSPYNISLEDKSVVDIGGGPVSLLLKCVNFSRAQVVDPCPYPAWVNYRYALADIEYSVIPAEKWESDIVWDEAWMYNCLQHTREPKRIVDAMRTSAKVIRIFEWIDTGVNVGHPHEFTAAQLDAWFGGEGKREILNGQANCYGTCWYGIFRGVE